MTAKTVTIFGGSGFVGNHLVQRLAREGWRVRVAVRRPNEVTDLRTAGDVGQLQIVQANVRDVASVEEAVQGADVVINLVGLLVQGGKQKFRAVHVVGAGNVARAAAAAGAGRLIQMSAIGADKNSVSAYGRTKAAGEMEVVEAFPEATILRPSVIFGPSDGFLTRLAGFIRMTPVVPSIGFGKTRFQPVHINDVIDAFVAVLASDETKGRIFELGGPDIFSLGQIQKMIAHETGRPRLFIPWPFWTTKINAFFLQMPYTFLKIQPLLTVDQVKLLQSDNVVGLTGEEGVGTFEDLGATQLVPLDAVLPHLMVRFRKHGQFEEQPAPVSPPV